jgi:DNA primase small subunit
MGDDGDEGPPPDVQRTLRWIRFRFRRYYRDARIHLPERFTRREWGFLYLEGGRMERHIGFSDRSELAGYLRERGPAHAYYSTAYYRNPGAGTMGQKDWLGSDLIFDLDADHMEDVEDLSHAEQLREIKPEARKVVDEFVSDHFGFDREHVHLFFSGNRGYHIHVTDPKVLDLGSQERREIVDYVTGLGLDVETVLTEKAFGTDEYGNPERTRLLPNPDEASGWDALVGRTFVDLVEEIASMSHRDAVDRLTDLEGVGEKTAEDFLRKLDETDWLETRGLAGVEGFEDYMSVFNLPPAAVKGLAQEEAPQVAEGEADEPVTADLKRLIRLPGSLHGKTGLRVTPIDHGELADFDPFEDAVAFGTDPVDVEVSEPATVTLAGTTYDVEPGEQTLDERAAIYLILRRKALLA